MEFSFYTELFHNSGKILKNIEKNLNIEVIAKNAKNG